MKDSWLRARLESPTQRRVKARGLMSFVVKRLPEAEADALEAAAWYDEQQSGLGDRFLDELDETRDHWQDPALATNQYGRARCPQRAAQPPSRAGNGARGATRPTWFSDLKREIRLRGILTLTTSKFRQELANLLQPGLGGLPAQAGKLAAGKEVKP